VPAGTNNKMKSEKGISLIEVLVALAILSIISASFLGGVATTSTARVTADERSSAKILAENLMEGIKKQSYAASYVVTIPEEFAGYSANLTVTNLNNIQKLKIAIVHRSRGVLALESYKANR
jgi:prepilin-type N-terminal cleavage/methylation domain-containing protein